MWQKIKKLLILGQGSHEGISDGGDVNQHFAGMMGVSARVAWKERGYWSNEEGRGFGGGAPKKFSETHALAINVTNTIYHPRIVVEKHENVAILENKKKMSVIWRQ